MGGSLLKGERLNQARFAQISKEVIDLLKPYYPRAEVSRELKSKVDFGDVDILVEGKAKPFLDRYKDELKPKNNLKLIIPSYIKDIKLI
ncbi:hypothetical protein GEMRC1_000284 [Eukaryota sp. GEM-RC1]